MTLRDQTSNLCEKSENSLKITTKILQFFQNYTIFFLTVSFSIVQKKKQVYNLVLTAEHIFGGKINFLSVSQT